MASGARALGKFGRHVDTTGVASREVAPVVTQQTPVNEYAVTAQDEAQAAAFCVVEHMAFDDGRPLPGRLKSIAGLIARVRREAADSSGAVNPLVRRRIEELEGAILRALQCADDEGVLGESGAFAILQGVVHDGIPAPYESDARRRVGERHSGVAELREGCVDGDGTR